MEFQREPVPIGRFGFYLNKLELAEQASKSQQVTRYRKLFPPSVFSVTKTFPLGKEVVSFRPSYILCRGGELNTRITLFRRPLYR